MQANRGESPKKVSSKLKQNQRNNPYPKPSSSGVQVSKTVKSMPINISNFVLGSWKVWSVIF